MELAALDRPELKDAPFVPVPARALSADGGPVRGDSRSRDILLYHPYDSFGPVVDFLRAAARDPNVLAIKQTLYRVGPNSPVVEALMNARENGKQVAVLVELKARFDEENNIVWARALERAGVHVVYGLVGLKTHAKMCLVVRREADGIRRYVHLGTGNYNPVTARIYTDLGLFTVDPEIATDVSDLFNALTGYSRKTDLLAAPGRPIDDAPGDPRSDRARDPGPPDARRRHARLQDQLPGRQALHPGALPGVAGRGRGRPPGARHLLSAARARRGQRHDHGDLGGRSVPRAHAHLLVPPTAATRRS